jgi:hypothetical protein
VLEDHKLRIIIRIHLAKPSLWDNPYTVISYQLSASSNVKLTVYDVLGNEVSTLVNGYQAAGIQNVKFDASKLNSGIYFYRIESGNFVSTKKMILNK